MMSPEQQTQVLSLASSYTVFIEKNVQSSMVSATQNNFYKTTNVFVKSSLAKPSKDALTSENLDALDN